MRILVACGQCQRQYDASNHPAGSRFHCACGKVLEVHRPEAHDATVVRCSACGGPRRGQEMACGYCQAEFTLHERDMHSICPSCMTRISDKAKHCHSCGVAIVPEAEAGEATGKPCPVCGEGAELIARQLGEQQLSVLECPRCAGLWVGAEVFQRLESEAKRHIGGAVPAGAVGGSGGATAGGRPSGQSSAQQGALYRPCVSCGKFMNRQNYGRRSGVIVDVCKQHGVWFDDRELQIVLDWIRHGGLAASNLRDEEERRAAARRARQRQASAGPSPMLGPTGGSFSMPGGRIGGAASGGEWLLEVGLALFRVLR